MKNKCANCSKEIEPPKKRFCSPSCKSSFFTRQWQIENGVKRKLLLVKAKGGKCEVCGYSKNLAALAFHHLDPKQKDMRLDQRKLTNTKLDLLLKEAEKCILVCHNCHAEIHYPQFDRENINL